MIHLKVSEVRGLLNLQVSQQTWWFLMLWACKCCEYILSHPLKTLRCVSHYNMEAIFHSKCIMFHVNAPNVAPILHTDTKNNIHETFQIKHVGMSAVHLIKVVWILHNYAYNMGVMLHIYYTYIAWMLIEYLFCNIIKMDINWRQIGGWHNMSAIIF